MSPKNLIRTLVICLLLAGGATAFANDGQPGDGRRGPAGGRNQESRGGDQPPTPPDSTQIVQIVEELAKALSLTDEQKDKISGLHFAHFAEVQRMMGQAMGDPADHRRKMDGLRDAFEKEVKAELNNEQETKFETMAKGRRTRPGPPGQRRQ